MSDRVYHCYYVTDHRHRNTKCGSNEDDKAQHWEVRYQAVVVNIYKTKRFMFWSLFLTPLLQITLLFVLLSFTFFLPGATIGTQTGWCCRTSVMRNNESESTRNFSVLGDFQKIEKYIGKAIFTAVGSFTSVNKTYL